MAPTVLTRKRLWGRAGNRCAFAECRQELIEDAEEAHGDVVVGEEAHIVAREEDGPRGQSSLPLGKERDEYSNLVLLCSRHHTIIDSAPEVYTVAKLLDLRAAHEKWVRISLGTPTQPWLERYAEIVDEWSERAALDRWTEVLGYVANASASKMPAWLFEQHAELRIWQLRVIWPGRISDLERAFSNFLEVLTDFQSTFSARAEVIDPEGKILAIRPQHRRGRSADYAIQEASYQEDIGLVEDLLLELTRAANHVCTVVRIHIDPQFRLREGALLIRSGPYATMDDRFHRAEYEPEEVGELYPGLEEFTTEKVRSSRNMRLSRPQPHLPLREDPDK